MKLAIMPNMTREETPQTTRRILQKLRQLGIPAFLPAELGDAFLDCGALCLAQDEMLRACDILLTVGGDGTILHAAKQAAGVGKPVLGINAGRLAFMAGLEADELELLERLQTKTYEIDSRMLLQARVIQGETVLTSAVCVNDAVIRLNQTQKSVELQVLHDGQPLNRYIGDGLIAATPTGSTAYSLSAGGPVVDPLLDSILLTPICTHSLFSRSLLFRPDATLCVSAPKGNELQLCCDGEAPLTVPAGAHVTLETAAYRAQFIRIKSDHFIHILNQKLAQWRA